MTTLFKHYCRRKIALAMSGLILLESVFPPSGWALTSGPGQPEFASFEPVSTSNMINPFTGDFTYNLPVLEVPGAGGGGYALSLAYNSGASPEEEASWVGYGWNLNPGVINRQKRGLPDDFYSKKVTYRNKMPKNWTVGLGGSIGNLEAFSFDIPLSVNAELRYNNYALDLIAEDQCKAREMAIFAGVRNSVLHGKAFSEALQETRRFSMYEYCSIQIGEETGKLPVILKELAVYHQKKTRQKRQIVQALTYPGLVLATSLAAVFFMLNFMVPMFADVFKRFGGKLPWITQLILDISHFFATYAWMCFIFGAIAGGLMWKNRKNDWFRKRGAALVIALPLIGEIIRKIYLARFSQSMTLLIASKVPLLRATMLVRQMIGFYPIEVALAQVEKDMMRGEFLHRSLSQFPVFPNRMLSLIKVGEEVNQLDAFFEKIATQYTEEVEHQTALIGGLLEPFMIVLLGAIVGFILIAMYLPLFQLSTTF